MGLLALNIGALEEFSAVRSEKKRISQFVRFIEKWRRVARRASKDGQSQN
jgi:hypothetical protein